MSAALAALLAVLKFLGWLLLILLVLALLLLCIPVMLAVEYRHGQLTASAHYGPVKLALYPKKEKPDRGKAGKRGKKAAAKAPQPAPPKETTPAPQPPKEASSSPASSKKTASVSPPPKETAPSPAPEQPATPNKRVQALLAALREDPLGVLEVALGHVAFAGGRLLRAIHVRHLQVFWTVTDARQDAAATAIQYGAQIAALNNLLVRAREHMEIQADFLRLEPDFTGERMDERGLSAEVSLRPIVAVLLAPRLLFRLLRDNVLRPILLGHVKLSEQ